MPEVQFLPEVVTNQVVSSDIDLTFEIRSKRVMFTSDVASHFGKSTKEVNKIVKRYNDYLIEDAFQLTEEEVENLRFTGITSSFNNENHGGNRYLPWVITKRAYLFLPMIFTNTSKNAKIKFVDMILESENLFVKLKEERILQLHKNNDKLIIDNRTLQLTNQKMLPKTKIYDDLYSTSGGSIVINQVSKILHLGKNKGVKYIYKLLIKYGYLQSNKQPYYDYISYFTFDGSKLLIKPDGVEIIRRLDERESTKFDGSND